MPAPHARAHTLSHAHMRTHTSHMCDVRTRAQGKGNMETFDARIVRSAPDFAARAAAIRGFPAARRKAAAAAASGGEGGGDGGAAEPSPLRRAARGAARAASAAAGCLRSALVPSAPEPPPPEGLGEESRRWYAAPGHGVETFRMKFRDPDVEGRFLDSQASCRMESAVEGGIRSRITITSPAKRQKP